MMLKQSKLHTNLPDGWQGKQPDYTKLLHNRLTPDKVVKAAKAAPSRIVDNRHTIQRLQAALVARRHTFAQAKKGSRT
jgi:hypothetical protein